MEVLRKKALKPGWRKQPWADEKAFVPLSGSAYRTIGGLTIELRAPIEEVQKVLSKALKPGRRLLSVVRFQDGRMEEVRAVSEKPALPPAPKSLPEPEDSEPQAALAATVAQPIRGCPAPDFPEADVRACRVLEEFLDGEQVEDFRSRASFVSFGQDTGHKYVITSREARRQLQRFGGRSLFDVNEGCAYCVHDWSVPAAEEMLALHLFLSVPGGESYLRGVPENYIEMRPMQRLR